MGINMLKSLEDSTVKKELNPEFPNMFDHAVPLGQKRKPGICETTCYEPNTCSFGHAEIF